MRKTQSRIVDLPLLKELFSKMEAKRILLYGVVFLVDGNYHYEVANHREIQNRNIDCKAIVEEHNILLESVKQEICDKVGFPCYIREDFNTKLFYKV